MIDKDKLKESLTLNQIENLVAELGGEPISQGDILICKTICHGGDSHKLYYYENTHLFQCYTNCGRFDIFGLVQKVKQIELPAAIQYVANYFNLINSFTVRDQDASQLDDWRVFENYDKIKEDKDETEEKTLKEYEDIVKYMPQPRIPEWENENISYETIKKYNIKYDPINGAIIIPHYDINGKLIGVRQRTLIEEQEQYGKYKPLTLNGQMYNHPLGFALYGLDKNKEAITLLKKAIVVESEKGVMQADTYLKENNIVVACCGSNILQRQIDLLLSLGVEEIIIAFDKQFKEEGDEEWIAWTNKLTEIHTKYSRYCTISFMFDKNNILNYKDSPTDRGEEVFFKMFKERIYI